MHSLTRVLVPFWASSVLSTWTHRSVRSLRGAVRLVIHPCPNTCTQHPLLLMPDAVLLLSTSGFSSHQRATQTYVWRSDGVRTEPDDDHSSDVEKNNIPESHFSCSSLSSLQLKPWEYNLQHYFIVQVSKISNFSCASFRVRTMWMDVGRLLRRVCVCEIQVLSASSALQRFKC